MKPQRTYLVAAFLLLLTSLGCAQSQEDARDAPKKLGETEALSRRGTLTVWVPNRDVVSRMNDPTVRLVNAYPWGILQSEFKRDFPDFDLDFKIFDRDEFFPRVLASIGTHFPVAWQNIDRSVACKSHRIRPPPFRAL